MSIFFTGNLLEVLTSCAYPLPGATVLFSYFEAVWYNLYPHLCKLWSFHRFFRCRFDIRFTP